MDHTLIVSKFGGSSLADEQAMERSARIAREQQAAIIVVSAVYGTTDRLLELIERAKTASWEECLERILRIRKQHRALAASIAEKHGIERELEDLLDELETLVRDIHLLKECSPKAEARVLSIGERMASLIFSRVYQSLHPEVEVMHFDVTEVMITDDRYTKAQPLTDLINRRSKKAFKLKAGRVYITQGFIGQTETGDMTTLGRGGSDYTASLLAEAVDADILEIWTDVAGIATTDPKICPEALPIHEISYDEASEMAQYGAKILHPTTLVPAIRKNIPVYVGSSYEYSARGTWIRGEVRESPLIRAITSRNDQALLTIRTPSMLNAVGFMDEIFGLFARHEISVDCVTTSEISVAITIDRRMMDNRRLVRDLESLGEVRFETGKALISLIGNDILSTHGLGKDLFNALGMINVRMVSLGASAHNFNLLVDEDVCEVAVRRLHKQFIEKTVYEDRAIRHG